MQAFRRGEKAVLAEVYTMYAAPLFRRLMVGFTVDVDGKPYRFAAVTSAFDLDDVVQETFVRAFSDSARASYDGVRPYRHYLAAIAKNLLVDRFRQARRLAECFTAMASHERVREGLEERELEAEARILNSELRSAYATFMASLDEPSRQLVRLRFESQASRQRVSEATGLSAMQIRAREKRLRGRLLRMLRGFGHLASWLILFARGGA